MHLPAVDVNLNPVLIESVNEESEILVVQCQIGKKNTRIINAYGPQEDEPLSNRVSFWQSIQLEIKAAKSEKCMVLVQLDGNAKLGKNIISQDPHNLSENGRLLLNIIESESLVLLNTSPVCQGVITCIERLETT